MVLPLPAGEGWGEGERVHYPEHAEFGTAAAPSASLETEIRPAPTGTHENPLQPQQGNAVRPGFLLVPVSAG